MSSKSRDELRKELEAVAERLWREADSEEDFRERLDEHMGKMSKDDLWAITSLMLGEELLNEVVRKHN
jgi:hypothetical protein